MHLALSIHIFLKCFILGLWIKSLGLSLEEIKCILHVGGARDYGSSNFHMNNQPWKYLSSVNFDPFFWHLSQQTKGFTWWNDAGGLAVFQDLVSDAPVYHQRGTRNGWVMKITQLLGKLPTSHTLGTPGMCPQCPVLPEAEPWVSLGPGLLVPPFPENEPTWGCRYLPPVLPAFNLTPPPGARDEAKIQSCSTFPKVNLQGDPSLPSSYRPPSALAAPSCPLQLNPSPSSPRGPLWGTALTTGPLHSGVQASFHSPHSPPTLTSLWETSLCVTHTLQLMTPPVLCTWTFACHSPLLDPMLLQGRGQGEFISVPTNAAQSFHSTHVAVKRMNEPLHVRKMFYTQSAFNKTSNDK